MSRATAEPRTMWRRQVAALEAAGVTALAVDLPGHGARMDERFTLDGGVAAIHDGVAALGGRALVVGLSLGGYLAVEHRAQHDEVARHDDANDVFASMLRLAGSADTSAGAPVPRSP